MKTILGPYMQYFLWAFASGIALAVVYDVLRLVRRVIPTCDAVINIEDICYLLLFGGIEVLLAYTVNNGILRLYAPAATVVAFAIYRLTVGNLLVDFSENAIRLIKKIVLAAVKILTYPFKLVLRLIKRPVLTILSVVGRGVRRVGTRGRKNTDK